MISRFILSAMLFLALPLSLAAQGSPELVRYVSTQGAFSNKGTSWRDAKNNLQDAINEVHDYMLAHGLTEGGRIYVAHGTYTPTESTEQGNDGVLYTAFKMYSGIAVYGGFKGDDTDGVDAAGLPDPAQRERRQAGAAPRKSYAWEMTHETVLSGNLSKGNASSLTWNGKTYTTVFPGNCYHVVWFATNGFYRDASGENTFRALPLQGESVLDGVTVTGGHAAANSLTQRDHIAYGGGIYMAGGAVVRNCQVTGNVAARAGGGVYMDGGGTIEQSYIHINQTLGVGVLYGWGGGVCADQAGLVRHCLIVNNVGRRGGGAALRHEKDYPGGAAGGDIYAPKFIGCVAANNTATIEAGGLYTEGGGLVNHATIARNVCNGQGTVLDGVRTGRSAGIYVRGMAKIFNTAAWGGTVAANNDIHYASSRDGNDRVTVSYSAFERADVTDWASTLKRKVINLEEDNDAPAGSTATEKHYYPVFLAPPAIAGVVANYNFLAGTAYLENADWQPSGTSDLRERGVLIHNLSEEVLLDKTDARLQVDINGNTFASRSVAGALVAEAPKVAPTDRVANLEGKDGETATLFVAEGVNSYTSVGAGPATLGMMWNSALPTINDALNYFRAQIPALKQQGYSHFQILVREGDYTTAGFFRNEYMRSAHLSIPSEVAIYGGFPEGLEGTELTATADDGTLLSRNPTRYETRVSGNILGDEYANNTCHILAFYGSTGCIVDGLKLSYANASSDFIFHPERRDGAGVMCMIPAELKPSMKAMRNTLRNCVISNNTAIDGAAIYLRADAGETNELIVENCIVHNNESGATDRGADDPDLANYPDPAAISVTGEGARLTLQHCNVMQNVGWGIALHGGARLSQSNSVVWGNASQALSDVATLSGSAVRTLTKDNASTVDSGSDYNLFDASFNAQGLGFTQSHNAASLTYAEADAGYTYPAMVNPTRNVGVTHEGHITIYGGTPDFMPRNMSPAVNAADSAKVSERDITCITPRNYGGLPDVGAVENTALPTAGSVVYVRQEGTGDGSSWARAMGDVQQAVQKAYNRMMKDASDKDNYTTTTQTVTEKYGKNSKEVTLTWHTPRNPEVQVWVAAGTYTRAAGYEMRNHVKVYGAFPATGNPGMDERHPLLSTGIAQRAGEALTVSDYETILQPSAKYNDSKVTIRVLSHPAECATTTGNASDVPQSRVVYEGVEWNGFTLRNGRQGSLGGRNGGAGVNLYKNAVINNCVVRDNYLYQQSDGGRGAGIYCDGGTVINSYVMSNTMLTDRSGNGGSYGGGIYCILGTIYNSVIAGNTLQGSSAPRGAAIFMESAEFYNNTLVNNTGTTEGTIGMWTASADEAKLTVYNTIVIGGSTGVLWRSDNNTPAKFYNCYLQAVNMSLNNEAWSDASNKKFNGAEAQYHPFAQTLDDANRNFDYRLAGSSLCVNAGQNEPGGVQLPPNDQDYADRIQDCTVDIGAYEYNGAYAIKPAETRNAQGVVTEAVYYVNQNGAGTASATNPQNAACMMKLQKVLDAAGRYLTAFKKGNTGAFPRVTVRLAGDDVNDATGFVYTPTRSAYTRGRAAENPRTYSFIVPRGVTIEGGYDQAFAAARDVQRYRTTLSGLYQTDGLDVNVYHIVTFTESTYDEEQRPLAGNASSLSPAVNTAMEGIGRAVIDGLFLTGGEATGVADEMGSADCYGGVALVTDYAHVRNCILSGNSARYGGGALALSPRALVSGCVFTDNSASTGGALYVTPADEHPADSDMAHVYTSTIVGNAATDAGGGVWFVNNVRLNSSVVWRNSSPDQANIAGQTDPNSSEQVVPTVKNYPLAYCAVENLRIPGLNNMSVSTDILRGVRFFTNGDAEEDPQRWLYQLQAHSVLVAAGMTVSEYRALQASDDLAEYSFAGQAEPRVFTSPGGEQNNFIDIGARAYGGLHLSVPIELASLLRRLYVAPADITDSEAINSVVNTSNKPGIYAQLGSSFANPMPQLDDALEYIRSARKHIHGANDLTFEVVISQGTFYPLRTVRGIYGYSRGNTFLVPEGVSLYGGFPLQDEQGRYYGQPSGTATGGASLSGDLVTVGDVELVQGETEAMLAARPAADLNENSVIEPWELRYETKLSGHAVNQEEADDVYHVITCIADANYVGELPTPRDGGLSAGTPCGAACGYGAHSHELGRAVVLDGLVISDGYAYNYHHNAVNNVRTFFKGGGVCVNGNWGSEPDGKGGYTTRYYHEAQGDDHTTYWPAVGWRDIPLYINRCHFIDNKAGYGGAVFSDGTVRCWGTSFEQNEALSRENETAEVTLDDGTTGTYTFSYAGCGGVMYANKALYTFNDLYANNEAQRTPGTTAEMLSNQYVAAGAAIYVGKHATLQAMNCNFVRNKAEQLPAIYARVPNTTEEVATQSRNQLINCVLWGNEAKQRPQVINFEHDDNLDASAEQLWFCAYEAGRGRTAVNTQDLRDAPYSEDKSVPQLLNADRPGEAQNCNIILSPENYEMEGPNFIAPSVQAGVAGFLYSADWMCGRQTNLTDNGWTKLKQSIAEVDGAYKVSFDKVTLPGGAQQYDGAGAYHFAHYSSALRHKYLPLGEETYMYYNDGNRTPMYRVSPDPNPTHNKTYIDIGLYEYQHIQLKPDETSGVDLLWVSTQEHPENGLPDGSTWERATSDVQRAIETLLATRNGHDKQVNMLEGEFAPVYTISGNLGFSIDTKSLNSMVLEYKDDAAVPVKSLTISGGYSDEVKGVRNVAHNPTVIRASKRAGVSTEMLGTLLRIDDATQWAAKDQAAHQTDAVVPITLDGITFVNPYSQADRGAAIAYADQRKEQGGMLISPPSDGQPKLTLSRCVIKQNGAQEATPAVTIGSGGGETLIYNTLFHSNAGRSLEALDTRVVNSTFALNGGNVELKNNQSKSRLRASVLWRNGEKPSDAALQGELTDETLLYLKTGGEEGAQFTDNAISGYSEDAMGGQNNTDLSAENEDIVHGPNFLSPRPEAVAPEDVAQRDFRLQPSIKLLNRTNVPYQTEVLGGAEIDRDKEADLANNYRYVDSATDLGAYEYQEKLFRVVYVDPNRQTLTPTGANWESAFTRGEMQHAIDLAAVYSASNGGSPSYVYVKALRDGAHSGESLIFRNGVSVYGSIVPTYTALCEQPLDGSAPTDAQVEAYEEKVVSERPGLVESDTHRSTVGGVTTAGSYDALSVIDGFDISASTTPGVYASVTRPIVDIMEAQPRSLTLRNAVVRDTRNTTASPVADPMQPGALTEDNIVRYADGSIVRANSGILYNVLLRANEVQPGCAVLAVRTPAHVVNSTVTATGEEAYALLSWHDPADGKNVHQVANSITWNASTPDNPTARIAVNVQREGGVASNYRVSPVAQSYGEMNALPADGGENYGVSNCNAASEGDPFAPYFTPRASGDSRAPLPSYITQNSCLRYQLGERSQQIARCEAEGSDAASGLMEELRTVLCAGSETRLKQVVDFATDRDLLGNPRVLRSRYASAAGRAPLDRGAYETWQIGTPTEAAHVVAAYADNHYPHTGSVVYLGAGSSLRLADNNFTETTSQPLRPGYLQLGEGASLYGGQNTVQLQYLSTERTLGEHNLLALPYAMDYAQATRPEWSATGQLSETLSPLSPQAYDGEARAAYAYRFVPTDLTTTAGASSCWQTEPGVVAPCTGVYAAAPAAARYRFTAFGSAARNYAYAETGSDKTVVLQQHKLPETSGAGHYTYLENMGWNLFGLPYLVSQYATGVGADSDYAMNVPHVLYRLNAATGGYEATPSYAEGAKVSVGEGLFAQTAVLADREVVTFRRPVAPQGIADVIAAQRLLLTGEGGSDAVGIAPDAEANTWQYTLGADAVKLDTHNSALPQLSVAAAGDGRYALMHAAPVGTEIALGVRVPSAGTYTLSLPSPQGYADYSAVWLTDLAQRRSVNLLHENYPAYFPEAADSPARFTVKFGGARPVLSPLAGSEAMPRAYIRGGVLHVCDLAGGERLAVIDAQGRTLVTTTAPAGEYTMPLPDGVYVVRVNGRSVKCR